MLVPAGGCAESFRSLRQPDDRTVSVSAPVVTYNSRSIRTDGLPTFELRYRFDFLGFDVLIQIRDATPLEVRDDPRRRLRVFVRMADEELAHVSAYSIA